MPGNDSAASAELGYLDIVPPVNVSSEFSSPAAIQKIDTIDLPARISLDIRNEPTDQVPAHKENLKQVRGRKILQRQDSGKVNCQIPTQFHRATTQKSEPFRKKIWITLEE